MQNIPSSFPTARNPQKWEKPPLLFPMLAHLSPFVGTRAPSSLLSSLLVLAGLSWKTRLGGEEELDEERAWESPKSILSKLIKQ